MQMEMAHGVLFTTGVTESLSRTVAASLFDQANYFLSVYIIAAKSRGRDKQSIRHAAPGTAGGSTAGCDSTLLLRAVAAR